MTNTQKNWFAGFGANAAPFQTYFAEAGERQQAVVKRSQKALEELTEVSRANVEALVDGAIAGDQCLARIGDLGRAERRRNPGRGGHRLSQRARRRLGPGPSLWGA